jgi:hypothetical protein
VSSGISFYYEGMDSILLKNVDRIHRIYKNIFDRFPEENGQTLSPSARVFIDIYLVF